MPRPLTAIQERMLLQMVRGGAAFCGSPQVQRAQLRTLRSLCARGLTLKYLGAWRLSNEGALVASALLERV